MSGPIWVMFCNQTTHRTPKYTDNKLTVRFYTKGKTNYSLTIRNGSVVLAPTNSSDPHQDLFQHHGEHGAIVADIQPVDLVVSHVLNRILSSVLSRPEQLNEQGRALELAIEAVVSAIIDLKDSLNEWDRKVGDGDCGSTMSRGATAIQEDLKKYYPLNDAAETINEIGSSIRRVMGGTSGILYDIFCKAAYARLKLNNQSAITTPLQWADAFEGAIGAVMLYGGAAAGYRTMLDALIPTSALLRELLALWTISRSSRDSWDF